MLSRTANEQASELAKRVFGVPLGLDEEAADVLRYYFEHKLGFAGGVVPDDVRTLDLPPVAELFRVYRARQLGDRPTGRWTRQARNKRPSKTPKL